MRSSVQIKVYGMPIGGDMRQSSWKSISSENASCKTKRLFGTLGNCLFRVCADAARRRSLFLMNDLGLGTPAFD
jgi:hypothetical protein